MKMILKDGTVLEGTPQEMAEYNRKNIIIVGKPPVKRVYAKKKTAKLWTGVELSIVKNNEHLSIKSLKRLLPGRTQTAVYQMRYAMQNKKMKPYQIKELEKYERFNDTPDGYTNEIRD